MKVKAKRIGSNIPVLFLFFKYKNEVGIEMEKRLDKLIAVKVGYTFNLFTREELADVSLKQVGINVKVEKSVYPLYCATSYQESIKIDWLLNEKGELRIREYLSNEVAI